ncbi:hypothetical protein J5N97_017280 [Dioscorea zingiberensis]|uniref:GDSL esterase/lipase n=1 Tax=Dioscorea zingiberensis TaxID=325984 RepID=A0A9D5HG77_9LILI|nr:hypothetical protein J5N97_017280 [Dioscorea zingiberensis]
MTDQLMKSTNKKLRMILAMLMIFVISLPSRRCSSAEVQFIFGDSLSDVGNNNYLTRSLARAALPWYGIDFGNGMPTGRFTNGRTIADIVGDYLGLPRPPAFLDPSLDADMILENGVNYASGGGGILNETSSLFIQRFSFSKQIDLFKGTQEMIRMKIGPEAAHKFFTGARYVVCIGSNDFINNYLLPVYADSWTYTGDSFLNYLITTLESQLRLLHSLGARQITFFGLGPMGCIPLQRILTSTGECQQSTNKLAQGFNKAAIQLFKDLSNTLPNSSFVFGDGYDFFLEIINQPEKYGFSNSDSPCCTIGKIRPTLTCTPLSTLCKDRSKYVFWDEYHPTDKTNELMANQIIKNLGYKPINGTKK